VMQVGTAEANAHRNIIINGLSREWTSGSNIYIAREHLWHAAGGTSYHECARMRVEVKEEDYDVNVQGRSTHTVKTGDYILRAREGQVAVEAEKDMDLYSAAVASVGGQRQLLLFSDSEIVLQTGASQIVLNSKGVFIDGPTVQINSGASPEDFDAGEARIALVPVPDLKSPGGREPVSPAVADDSKSGFASSARAAKQTPAQSSGNGPSKGTTAG